MKKITKSVGLMSLMFSIATIGLGYSTAQAATYTSTDVASHNTQANCWVIINSSVYNLTNFISTHPGGASVIINQCGKDGTAVFNSGPHSSSTISALSPYLLGTIASTTPSPTPGQVVTPPTTNTHMDHDGDDDSNEVENHKVTKKEDHHKNEKSAKVSKSSNHKKRSHR